MFFIFMNVYSLKRLSRDICREIKLVKFFVSCMILNVVPTIEVYQQVPFFAELCTPADRTPRTQQSKQILSVQIKDQKLFKHPLICKVYILGL